MATIKDIAAFCGTSRGTVDRVLNGRGHVKPEVAEKVLKAAAELDYKPNKAGMSLAARKKNYRIAFILCDNNGKNPFYISVKKGIDKKAEELSEFGMAVEVFSCPADGYKKQLEIIENCENNNFDALAITPVNHPELAVRLRKLSEGGIPVVTVNSDMEFSGRIAYVGSNYRTAGQTAAGLMGLITGGKAKVGIVSGFPDVLCHTERVDAFCSHMSEFYKDIEICGMRENMDDDFLSYEKTKELLLENPEINAMYLAAAGVAGACRAIEETGRAGEIKVICFDDVPETVELIKKGVIAAAICQQPEYQGSKPLDILSESLAFGGEAKEYNYCSTEIRIRENCR